MIYLIFVFTFIIEDKQQLLFSFFFLLYRPLSEWEGNEKKEKWWNGRVGVRKGAYFSDLNWKWNEIL